MWGLFGSIAHLLVLHLPTYPGFKFPKVVGVDWRLDYELRSSTTGKLSSHRYFVKLRTLDSSGNDDDFDFTCSYEQVKDLLAKVEDAKKQLERAMKGMR